MTEAVGVHHADLQIAVAIGSEGDAGGLEKAVMHRQNRNLILDRRLVLISLCDPKAGFNVGNAMQRNKLIYALADAALVANADLEKGGTWAGATEQLKKLRSVPVYVSSTGIETAGLARLRSKGAKPWPNPADADGLEVILATPTPTQTKLWS